MASYTVCLFQGVPMESPHALSVGTDRRLPLFTKASWVRIFMRHIGSGVPPSRRGEYILELSMTTLSTPCPMDCPDTCALEVAVEEGRIASIRGAKDHPTTAGFICSKVAHFGRRVYHSDRLLYPMRRTGPKGFGEFRRISWEEAVGEITSRFREIISRWGAEPILPSHYAEVNGVVSDGSLDSRYC